MIVPLLRFATDKRLGGATLIWRPVQLQWLAAFGDDSLRLVVGAAGRQGGKSSLAACTAIWNAVCRDDLDAIVPRGRTRSVLVSSASDDQARELLRIAAGMIEASPVLRELATIQATTITFKLPSGATTELRSLATNPSTARGRSASLCICDEYAHVNSDSSGWNSDARMLEALEGSMSTFDAVNASKLICISTPNGESGEFHRLYCEARDGQIPNARALHEPAWTLNPSLDSDAWRESKIKLLGLDGFRQEHGGEFVVGGGSFFNMAELRFDALGPAHPEDAESWSIGLDPAFHSDRFGVCALGPSRQDPGVFVVGALHAIEPQGLAHDQAGRRAGEDRALAHCWELLAPFRHRIDRIYSDQHDGISIKSFFGDRGVEVEIVNVTGPILSEMLVSVRSRLTTGSLRCWPEDQLVEDLRRVRARRGSESVTLPSYGGGHADMLAALGMALRGATGTDYNPPSVAAVAHPGRGWSDGENRSNGSGFIPGNVGQGYESPGAPAWLGGGSNFRYDDW